MFLFRSSLYHLIQLLQLTNIESADVHCVGCHRYNVHVYFPDEISIINLAICYHFHPLPYLFLHSFEHCFRSDIISLFNSQEFIYFAFIWVRGLHSFLQHLKAFSSHHLVLHEYEFRTLQHSIAGSGVMAGLNIDLADIL